MNKINVLLVSSSLIVGIGTGVALVSWFTVKPFKILPPCDSLTTVGDCVVLPFSSPSAISTPEQTPATTPEQSGKIDDHLFIDLTLRDVNFCGKIYKVKQVIIDGVDVVQRIAEIATEMNKGTKDKQQLAGAICGNIEFGLTHRDTTESHLPPDEPKIYGPQILDDGSGALKYVMGIGTFIHFVITYPNLQIEIAGAEEGGSIIIGKLK